VAKVQKVILDLRDSSHYRLHWEALYDPEFGEYLALHAAMVRKNIVPQISPAIMKSASTINVLVVVARPGGARDVGYRTISRLLMDELERTRLPVEVTLLRPGTYQALVTHLEQATRAYGVGHYHLIHFDVHGALLDHAQLERGARAAHRSDPGSLLLWLRRESLQPFA
jgi:hypothetical protein